MGTETVQLQSLIFFSSAQESYTSAFINNLYISALNLKIYFILPENIKWACFVQI